MREQLTILEPTLGYKIKVVEKIGRSLKNSFSQTSIWKGLPCGRTLCTTCNQGGEEVAQCTLSGVTYENICTKCNPAALAKGELKEPRTGVPSLYVGETSRSIQERAEEHWGAVRRGDTNKSHMLKHQAMEHNGEPPEFIFKVIGHHKTALNRQIKEAVRIRRRGGANQILNSKGEFNRCYIPRLVVHEEDEGSKKMRMDEEAKEEDLLVKCLEEEESNWMGRKARERDKLDKKRNRQIEGEEVLEESNMMGRRKRAKRLRYSVIKEDWGKQDR